GWLTQGPKVAEMERAMAAYVGTKHAVAVSSCTAALHLSLTCAGVGPGDEVVVPSMSFIATANAVVHAGGVPVFCEVDPVTFNPDPADVERRIGPRTKAVLVVHQLGLPAPLGAFRALAARRGVALVEDAACALGSRLDGRPIGGHSELVCFSFHPRKVVTMGDGGIVTTDSDEHAARLRRLRQHGMSVSDAARHESATVIRETYEEVGWNFRLTDLQAAVGIEQLRRLPELLARRRAIAARYDAGFRGSDVILTPPVPPGVEWNVQSYAVRLKGYDAARRDAVMQRLLDRGIATRAGVMTAHREPAYRARGSVSLPVSEAASDGSLILPSPHRLTEADQDDVIASLRAATK
ncbi:MAG: DegT/DnrJ/EryC1/StrS family aminotransferase, partial [bacterium]